MQDTINRIMAKINTDPAKIDRLLTRGVTEVISREHLKQALLSGKQLRVKLGFDPTGNKIHIGRAIILRKLREFQNLGHKVVFIVGDATALIGDPSDKLDKRPKLTEEKIRENLKDYKEQVGKIVNVRKAEFVFNSKWLKKLSFLDSLNLARSFSVNQMLARRNFSERMKKQGEIGLEELSYPLMQGFDSVAVKADVEIGGFDQLFNLKAGRTIQKYFGFPEQDILTMEMLEGTDGRKMSTSWGNVINIMEEPNNMFGKIMSVKDELVDKYFKLCTDLEDSEIAKLPANPKDKKLRLAFEIVKIYHDVDAAEQAQDQFEQVFGKKGLPADIETIRIDEHSLALTELLVKANLAASKSAARRLIEQGGVKVDNERKTDSTEIIVLDHEVLIQVGPRRFVKISGR